MLNRLVSIFMVHFFRWFPHRTLTGLRAVGHPGDNSPVLVTGNYSLTVFRLLASLRGLDLWVLVAQSNGINIWCAAAAGEFTATSVADAVNESQLAQRVGHRTLILPALCAPGVSAVDVRAKTGFKAIFGPVSASDIPEFIERHYKKTEAERRFPFGFRHRLDMLVAMNFIIWLVPAAILAIFFTELTLHFSALFWLTATIGYLFFPFIPGKGVRHKSLALTVVAFAGYALGGIAIAGNPIHFFGWALTAVAIIQAVCFEMGGIVAPLPSDAEKFLFRRHLPLPQVLRAKEQGSITVNLKLCIGCFNCTEICPLGVFDVNREQRKTKLVRPRDCFSCGACVLQCPTNALSL
jgi:NAD-dependent dihydropyrimidine dehydrogenase PreA subunit